MVSHHYSFNGVQLKKTAQDSSTVLKVLLDVLKYILLQELVEIRPSKNFGSNEPWDLGEMWQIVLYWQYFFRLFSSQIVLSDLKKLSYILSATCQPFSKVVNNEIISTIDVSFNLCQKSLNILITVEQSIYHAIGQRSNRI